MNSERRRGGGRWSDQHYQTSLRQAYELFVVIQQAEGRSWDARMLVDRNAPGGRYKARELLTEAFAMYSRIGMPEHVEMGEALLSEV